METSRIEEIKKEFQMFVPEDDGSAMDWLENTLAEAKQAGIDEAVEENKKLRLHLSVILPMAKGYVHKNDVGRNREMVSNAEDYLAELDDTIKALQDNK